MLALKGVADYDDLSVRGLGSLQAIELGRLLRSGLRQQYNAQRLNFISAQLIFESPTISQLSTRIHRELSPTQLDGVDKTRRDSPTDMVNKYTSSFEDRHWPARSPQQTTDLHVLLTGSTGSLGRQMLEVLLNDPTVSKVTCLDRDPKAGVRNKQQLHLHEGAWSNASFKKAVMGEPNLGLSKDELELFDQADLILHCA
jgi:Male sterility protein